MRALTALGIFKETGAQCYGPTPLSLLLVGPEVRDELKLLSVNDPDPQLMANGNGIASVLSLSLWANFPNT